MPKNNPKKIPDIVIRPSGVWNSRAPFHDFLLQHRLENRVFYLSILTIEKIKLEAKTLTKDDTARKFFMGGRGSKIAGRSFIGYRRSYPKLSNGEYSQPTKKKLMEDVEQLSPAIIEHALVSYSSLFETFVQCWALNYLLAKLENGKGWNDAERGLAFNFNPVIKNDLPTVIRIGAAFPLLVDELSKMPHIHTKPGSHEEVKSPSTPELNAWKTILFWRQWRNLLIHRSGVVSENFKNEHGSFFEQYRKQFFNLPPLKRGEKLRLFDVTFAGMVTTHYKAANWMNQQLEIESEEKRGHPYYPKQKPQTDFWENPPQKSPFLLMEGDHAISLKWERAGKGFQESFSKEHFSVNMKK